MIQTAKKPLLTYLYKGTKMKDLQNYFLLNSIQQLGILSLR